MIEKMTKLVSMAILCTLQNLTLSFGDKLLFKDTKLTIDCGDRIGLLGLNGHGKSSLFKIITGEVAPDISYPPFRIDKATGRAAQSKEFSVLFIPQVFEVLEHLSIKNYIFSLYPKIFEIHQELEKINSQLEESYTEELLDKQNSLLEAFEQLKGWDISQYYQSYLKLFGLDDIERSVDTLSGGEQKKILLSIGLSAPHNLVLWDEPTNHLDIDTIKLFEEELKQCENAFALITHDRYLLSKVCSRICHINAGKIETFEGNYASYLEFRHAQEKEKAKLITKLKNSLRRETAWMRQGIKARGTRSKKRVETYNSLRSSINEYKENALKELDITITESQRKTKKLIEIKDLSFEYSDQLFNNLNLNINKNDKIGLLGKNGVGKTTLLEIINGSIDIKDGEIKRAEQLSIQYFTQKRKEIADDKTPYELLGDGRDHITLPDDREIHIASYFQSFLFRREDLHRPLGSFSGGERNRLQMALNLKRAGDLWIFDEPTNDLDLETLQLLERKLAEFKGSIILISHDRTFLSTVTNKIWLLQDKKIETFAGGYDQVENYLEALCLEEMFEKDNKQNIPPEKQSTKPNPKMLQDTTKTIEQLESELELIEKKYNSMDFTNISSKEDGMLIKDLEKQKNNIEETLLELYENLENLSV